jgi:DNA-binding NtrC family response regulator
VSELGILIIDDDEQSQAALWHVLDSEGWNVEIVPLASQALTVLAQGGWKLVIVNVAMSDLSGPLFTTLKELALSPALAEGQTRARVLFIVPTLLARQAQPALEREHLPYVLKPLHLHDFLDKVSDLLLEAQAITEPLRPVLREAKGGPQRRKAARAGSRGIPTMFASREDYMMTEEEIAEWEKQEQEEREKKKKKAPEELY